MSFGSFSGNLVKWPNERPWRVPPLAAYAYMMSGPAAKKPRRIGPADQDVSSDPGDPLSERSPSLNVLATVSGSLHMALSLSLPKMNPS